jgi:lipopolysaccharide export system permease protein
LERGVSKRVGTFSFGLIDRYLLRMLTGPLIGCLAVTIGALILERVLRLLDLLSNSNARFGYVAQLAANLLPHYLGLALPVAFFIALFVVITKLSDSSEIDALLAGGRSLTRILAPFVAVGIGLSLFSVIVFGYMQPYSRYAYRSVMHAAVTAGWNGRLPGRAFVDDGKQLITADESDAAGEQLKGIFIKRPGADGREEVITAGSAALLAEPGGEKVALILTDGRRIAADGRGGYRILTFAKLNAEIPLAGAEALLRSRGGDERELTLSELVRQAANKKSVIPHQTLLAEFYGRLARALFLPFLPLLAFPLGLAAKRGRRAAGLVVAGILLVAFQYALLLGQGLAEGGKALAFPAIWIPFAMFTGLAVWMFVGGRERLGDTPLTRLLHMIGDGADHLAKRLKVKFPKRRAA